MLKIEGYEIIFPQINLEGVDAVLIDIDNTLYSYEPPHQKALKYCHEELRVELSEFKAMPFEVFEKAYRAKRTEVTKRLSPQGVCRSRMFAFQSLFEGAGCISAYTLAAKYENMYWNVFIKNMKVNEGALSFLNECKVRKLKVCAVSDMQSHFQVRKLDALGVGGLIDFLTTSEEVGVEKPDSLIFEASLDKLGISADGVIMVGDSMDKDINGAEKLGIKSYKVLVK